MNRIAWVALVAIVLPFISTAPAWGQLTTLDAPTPAEATDLEFVNRLSQLVKRVAREATLSVVHIEAEKAEKKQGRTEEFEEAGSGVVVQLSKGIYILTNRHVITGAANGKILLRLNDGREFHPAEVLEDASTDVALMRIDTAELTPARTGDSSKMEIGDFVIAIGSPFGLSHSVTFGILSAVGRRSLTLGEQSIEIQDFFQTDAAINPGNSGGPLLNLRGEVVGLNTAIASSSGGSEGIGFAIPINMALRVAEQLANYGRLRRGYLGVTLDPSFGAVQAQTLGLPRLAGAHVKAIDRQSPAGKGGIEIGDVILSFDGVTIENDDHLVTIVGLTEIDRPIPVVVYRRGQQRQLDVTLSQRTP